MTHTIHTLSETAKACGVTLADVSAQLPRGVFRSKDAHHDTFVVAQDVWSPALASEVARCAFGVSEVEYIGRTHLGHAYQIA